MIPMAAHELDDRTLDCFSEDEYDLEVSLERYLVHVLSERARGRKGLVPMLMNDPDLLKYARVLAQGRIYIGLTPEGRGILMPLLAQVSREESRRGIDRLIELQHQEELDADVMLKLSPEQRFGNQRLVEGWIRTFLASDGNELADGLTRADMTAYIDRKADEYGAEDDNPKRLLSGRCHWRRAREQRRIAARVEQRALDREIGYREDLLFRDAEHDAAFEEMIARDDGGSWEQYMEHCEWAYEVAWAEEDRRNSVVHFYTEWYWELYAHRTDILDDPFVEDVRLRDEDFWDLDEAMASR